jgi:hypothetical protein
VTLRKIRAKPVQAEREFYASRASPFPATVR